MPFGLGKGKEKEGERGGPLQEFDGIKAEPLSHVRPWLKEDEGKKGAAVRNDQIELACTGIKSSILQQDKKPQAFCVVGDKIHSLSISGTVERLVLKPEKPLAAGKAIVYLKAGDDERRAFSVNVP